VARRSERSTTVRWRARASRTAWGGHLGITELAVTAFAKSHRAYREDDGPFMRNAITKIRNAAKPDGSITEGGQNESTKNYTTALGILALKSLGDPKDADIVQKAQKWMKAQQAAEDNGYKPEDKLYGGFGCGSSLRPTSRTQFALEALRASGLPASDPVFAKAAKFISRTQNRTESMTYPGHWTTAGSPTIGVQLRGRVDLTGSMTYAGIKSYLYAEMDKDDPRVQALKWIAKNSRSMTTPDAVRRRFTTTSTSSPGRGTSSRPMSWSQRTACSTTGSGSGHEAGCGAATGRLLGQQPEADNWEDRPELCTSTLCWR
jgi:hypothetical protein